MKRLGVLFCILFVTAGSQSLSHAQDLKIGFLLSFSGRLSVHGALSRQGAELAINEINNSGGINGRKLAAIFEDDGGDAKQSAAKFKELIEKQNVDVVMGVITSDAAMEASQLANSLRVPLIITTAQAPEVTGKKCNPYTFRVCRNSDGMIRTAAVLAKKLPVKQWTTVGPDYVFGHDCWASFKKNLGKAKPDVKFVAGEQTAFAPMTNADWSAQIKTVMDSGADGVLVSLYAGNLIDFLKQGAKQGLFDGKRTVVTLLGSFQTLVAMGVEMPKGIWMTPPYYYSAYDGAANREFVKGYEQRYNAPPDYQAQFAYCGVKAYAEALKKAGTTDKKAVLAALDGLELDLPVGRAILRKEDHQAVFDCYAGMTGDKVVVVESGGRRIPVRSLEQGQMFGAAEVTNSPEESGCNMPGR